MGSFVEFAVPDTRRFAPLVTAFDALKAAKETGVFGDEIYWRAFFDPEALTHFWWPAEAELDQWLTAWRSAPVQRRHEDPSLHRPWTFMSMIQAFENCEFELVACRMRGGDEAVLEFEPDAFPYGGTECIRVLVEAFGFRVIGEDDGTGYRSERSE